MKTIQRSVVLTHPQDVYLRREAKRLGVSVADALRRIVDAYRGAETIIPSDKEPK